MKSRVTSSDHPARAIPRGELVLGRDIIVRCTEVHGEHYDAVEKKRRGRGSPDGIFSAKIGREETAPMLRAEEWSCSFPSA